MFFEVAPSGIDPDICWPRTFNVSPASLSVRVSPIQIIAINPASCAACALALIMAFVSPWSVLRSECPTMTYLAPVSAIWLAEISPVCAPEDTIWQSCAPMPIFRPISQAGINRDADGQMTTAGSVSSSAALMASTSDKLACVPFIFQFPAASLRIFFSFGAGHLVFLSFPRYCPFRPMDAREC